MSYITRYTVDIIPKDIKKKLKNTVNKTMANVETYKIGNFIFSKNNGGYIHGKIAVKRAYDDYFFDLTNDYEIETKPNSLWVYDEVNFTIFPDIKVISFTSKEKAILFGMTLLSSVLFDDCTIINGIIFNPQDVFEAKRKGLFSNIWFNGVRFTGNIGYMGQYGDEIDEDINFINLPEKREGIGIVFHSKTGKILKVGIFKEGALVRKTKLKDFKDDIILEKEVIKAFLPHSNYGLKIPNKTVDDIKTLKDYI